MRETALREALSELRIERALAANDMVEAEYALWSATEADEQDRAMSDIERLDIYISRLGANIAKCESRLVLAASRAASLSVALS